MDYDPTRAGRLIDAFVNDDLSNWYVRLNRKRFWGKEMSEDKLSRLSDTLYLPDDCGKVLAPFAPFFADQLYHDLGGKLESVHLDTFPKVDESLIDADLEARMGWLRRSLLWFSPCAVR
jgi:isoleucyl-tRNA synthetase